MNAGVETPAQTDVIVSVRRIMVESPACKAGVREGDIIRSVDGTALDAENTLTTMIMNRKPGSSVTLELMRGTKKVVVKVSLGTRVLPAFKFRPIERAHLYSESVDANS
jgi:S1-C subfamily serine protease